MKAFWDLCSDRKEQGHKIPWTVIQWWCEANRIEDAEREDVHFLVGRLDIAFLQWQQKKAKAPAKRQKDTLK